MLAARRRSAARRKADQLLDLKTAITESVVEAAAFIRSGGLVAFPTETVYGLGADVFSESAIKKIFAAKGRPSDNPLIVHIVEIAQIDKLASEVTRVASALAKHFFPGPLTIVLKKSSRISLLATAGLDTVGIRMPRHPTAAKFLAECRAPVAAPSANLSGRPSPTTWQAVLEDLDGRIDCILRGDATAIGLESTVVDCTSSIPTVLRLGAISVDEIREVVPEVRLLSEQEPNLAAKSPGLRHQHYSPTAEVIITDENMKIDDASSSAYIGLSTRHEPFQQVRVCSNLNDYARELFEFFRVCDREAIRRIYCERVESTGIGAALMDRIERAATRRPSP